jgi:hypothetical protein
MYGCMHNNYSYRLRYNGLPASLFPSSLEMLLNELAFIGSVVCLCLAFNLCTLCCSVDP